MGGRSASAITPQEIDSWLNKHTKTPATYNRYRAFLSMVYRQAMLNRKQRLKSSPACSPAQGPPGRIRFLDELSMVG